LKLKNRIIMAAMGLGAMAEKDGEPTEKVLEFYLARARGGIALFTTGSVPVSQELEPMARTRLNLYSDKHLDSLRRIVDEVHRYGARVAVQLTAGVGRVVPGRFLRSDTPPISASATSFADGGIFERFIMLEAKLAASEALVLVLVVDLPEMLSKTAVADAIVDDAVAAFVNTDAIRLLVASVNLAYARTISVDEAEPCKSWQFANAATLVDASFAARVITSHAERYLATRSAISEFDEISAPEFFTTVPAVTPKLSPDA